MKKVVHRFSRDRKSLFRYAIWPLALVVLLSIPAVSFAAFIGNNFEQQAPRPDAALPSVGIDGATDLNAGQTLELAADAQIDQAAGGTAFFAWYADKGSFEALPEFPDYSKVLYTAPQEDGAVKVAVQAGDSLGYSASALVTMQVDGSTATPTDPPEPVNGECAYTVTPSGWQHVYHVDYLLTPERTSTNKPSARFRVQPVFADMKWDYSGTVRVVVGGAAATLYGDSDLAVALGKCVSYNPGDTSLEFFIDADFSSHKSVILEHSEDNYDSWEMVWMLKADCPEEPTASGDPDLKIDGFEVKPSFAVPGEQVQLRVRVRNYGDGPSGPSTIGFYLATEGSLSKLAEQSVGALESGMSAFAEPLATVPADLFEGQYEVLFRADDAEDVAESNEFNNDRFALLVVGAEASEADLAMEVFDATPDTAVPGDTVRVAAAVKNIGGTGTAASSRLGYFFSEDPYFQASDVLLGASYFGYLAPGASSETFDRTFVLPTVLETDRDYYILAVADYEDKVLEVDQAPENNVAVQSVEISYSKEMTVLRPDADSSWGHDRTYDISWTSNLAGTVQIDLYKSLNLVKTIANAAPNTGSYQWTVTSDLPVLPEGQKQYWINISSNADPAFYDKSEKFAIVYPDTLTVLSPQAGEIWGHDTSKSILWRGTFDGNVEIQLLKGDSLHQVAATTETTSVRDCQYTWIVPSDIEEGDDYRIRVVNAGDVQTNGVSQGFFSIAAMDEESIPVAVDDAAVTAENTPTIIEVLVNDNPPANETLFVEAVSSPKNGSVAIDSDFQSVTYTPNANFTGSDSFTYTVRTFDQMDHTAQVTVSVVSFDENSWATMIGEQGEVLAMDGAGNVFLFNGISLQKYSPSGAFLWRRSMDGGWGTNGSKAAAVDHDGNAYVLGTYKSYVPFVFKDGDTVLHTIETVSGEGANIFVAKFAPDGDLLWVLNSQGVYEDIGSAIAVDGAAGKIYISGLFDGTMTIGSGASSQTLTDDSTDLFIAQLDLDGNLRWVKQLGCDGGEIPSMHVGASGDLFATGAFKSVLAFPGSPTITLSSDTETYDAFAAKFDSDGNAIWAQKASGASSDFGRDIAVDVYGSLFVGGSFESDISFYDGASVRTVLGSAERSDWNVFLAKYGPDGAFQWAKEAGGPGADVCGAVGLDPDGNPSLAGSMSGGATFGAGTTPEIVNLASASAAFVASYTAEGEFQSLATAAGTGNSYYSDMAIDLFGHYYLSGSCEGDVSLAAGDAVFTLVDSGYFAAKLVNPESLDRDGDSVQDDNDSFPDDPSEWEDTDGDGFGDNADEDDDNDGMSDAFEIASGLDPKDASDATEDPDSDGYTNFQEFQLKTDPNQPSAFDAPSHWKWAKQAVGSDSEEGRAVAVDKNRNVFAVGMLTSETVFGDIVYTPDNSGMFVAKYDSEGTCLWVRSAYLNATTRTFAVVADNAGNVYVGSSFWSVANFGTVRLYSTDSSTDSFLAKYSPDGALLWVKQTGGSDREYVQGLASDGVYVYATGYFRGTGVFGSRSVVSAGDYDMFLAKYDSSGNCLWAKGGGGADSDKGKGIAFDGAGKIFVAGEFKATASFDGASLTSRGSSDLFMAKYDTGGTLQWVKSAGGTGVDCAYGAAADGAGNAYLTAQIADNAVIGPFTLGANASYAPAVAKYGSDGSVLWAKNLAGNGSAYGIAYAATAFGTNNLLVRGYFNGNADFGGGQVSSDDYGNTFLAAYGLDGAFQWVEFTSYGSTEWKEPQSIASDQAGDVYVTGEFRENMTLGKDTLYLTGGASSDFFLAKLTDDMQTLGGLLVTPPLSEVSAQGGDISIQVEKQGFGVIEWTAQIEAEAPWLSIRSGGSGIDDGTIVLTAEANPHDARFAILTVSSPQATNPTTVVHISQAATADSDGDGIDDIDDPFPDDPAEWQDTDGDGVGDNTDVDDDNDGMFDLYEAQYGLNSTSPDDAYDDPDDDGLTNLRESIVPSDPTDPNDPTPPTQEIAQEVVLREGWNLMSLSVLPGDGSPGNVFDSVADRLVQVKDMTSVYDPALPAVLNTLKQIEAGKGYWVELSYEGLLSVVGEPVETSSCEVELRAGWNLIGYPLQEEKTVEEALASIMDVLVQAKNLTQVYDPALPPVLNTLKTLVSGSGYWIKVTADAVLQFPANS